MSSLYRKDRHIKAVAVVAVFLAIALAYNGRVGANTEYQGPCPQCRAELISQQDLIGGFECPHGPEYDQADCAPVGGKPPCCETAPGGCPPNAGAPNNGICSCFTCGNDVGKCEEFMHRWIVWCGLGAGGACDTTSHPAEQGVVFTVQPMTIAQVPLACNPQTGVITAVACGTQNHTLACKAPDNVCVPQGNLQEFVGTRRRCGPGGF